ncbi:MAG: lipopolysaccharide kinase InaA family protein [Fimbriiglobus sp.]
MSTRWKTWADPEWPTFAGEDWLEHIMTVDVQDRLHKKQGRSIARWTLTSQGRELVVYLKRHFVLPKLDQILARAFPIRSRSPGWQEFENLQWAKANGLPVPRVLAAGETTRGPLQSFLIVEELTGMLALHEAIPLAEKSLKPGEFLTWKKTLTVAVAHWARELHRRRAYHRDLYLCHFYIPEAACKTPTTDWHDRIVMIDFHRLKHRPWFRRYDQIKDLAQFLFSTVGVSGITPRDLVRFRREYERGDWTGDVPPGRWLDRAIRVKAARYARHNQKHA